MRYPVEEPAAKHERIVAASQASNLGAFLLQNLTRV